MRICCLCSLYRCVQKACESLEILETDYFGLSYSGSKGEELWLNLRNRVDSELHDSPPHRLNLLVKFYIKPHMIQQATARSGTCNTLYLFSDSFCVQTNKWRIMQGL